MWRRISQARGETAPRPALPSLLAPGFPERKDGRRRRLGTTGAFVRNDAMTCPPGLCGLVRRPRRTAPCVNRLSEAGNGRWSNRRGFGRSSPIGVRIV
jgi:hypothetical protein